MTQRMTFVGCVFGLTALLCAGCYRLAGTMEVEVVEESRPLPSVSAGDPVVVSSGVVLDATVVDGALQLDGTRVRTCQDAVIERVAIITREERSLPASHWFVLGGCIVALGGGGVMIALGVNGISDGEDMDVGYPDDEEAYDTAQSLLYGGIALSALGVAALTSETVDLLSTGAETTGSKTSEQEALSGEPYSCGEQPAAGAQVSVESPGGKAVVLLRDNGRRVLPLDQPPLQPLVEGAAALTVRCEGCEPVTVSLSKGL